MKLSPQASITVNFGGGRSAVVDWSLSPTGADDSPREVLIHKAVEGLVDLVKQDNQADLDAITAAVRAKVGI